MTPSNEISERIMQNVQRRLSTQGDHLQVKDVNGEHVGTVDHCDAEQLKLTRSDSADGQHHHVPLSQVESVDDVAVYLNVPRSEVQ